jgi:type IV pilus assembly protein PilB
MLINKQLCDLFVREGLINKKVGATVLEKANSSNARFDKALVQNRYIDEEKALSLVCRSLGIRFVNLDVEGVRPELLSKVPAEYIKKYSIMPVKYDGNDLMVAVGDPYNITAANTLKFYFKNNFKVVVALESQIKKVTELQMNKQNTESALGEMEQELKTTGEIKNIEELSEEDVANAPAVKLADAIIKEAVTQGASDIHIEPFEENVRVRYRIDGMLLNSNTFTKKYYPAVLTRYKIMAGINIAERRIPQDGRIRLEINGADYDFRVSTLPTVHGEKIVIRIFDNTTRQFSINQLGFLKEEEELIYKILARPHGIVLVTGPTGSGKSTTLYAFLKELNKADVNIITVEDPVENEIPGINQTQVNNKANLTFAAAMRSILRQDPNIIMIGEIRDEETAQIAIRAAITGHLVLSTVHTNDAPGTVNRLVDMGVPAYLVADATIGIIAQRLVRTLCTHCKKEVITSEAEMKILKLDQPVKIYHPVGCTACNFTGYRGRMGVHEVMAVDAELTRLIETGATADIIRAKARANGMLSLWDTCRQNVLRGKTSIQELQTLVDMDKGSF